MHCTGSTECLSCTPGSHSVCAVLYFRLITSHRLTSWRGCCLSDSGTEWSSDSSAGNCCHLNGIAGIEFQWCCGVGSLTLASPRHRNTHCTVTTSAVAYSVSCNVTVAINAWDTPPSNENANKAGSHGSHFCGCITRGCMGVGERAVNRNHLQF